MLNADALRLLSYEIRQYKFKFWRRQRLCNMVCTMQQGTNVETWSETEKEDYSYWWSRLTGDRRAYVEAHFSWDHDAFLKLEWPLLFHLWKQETFNLVDSVFQMLPLPSDILDNIWKHLQPEKGRFMHSWIQKTAFAIQDSRLSQAPWHKPVKKHAWKMHCSWFRVTRRLLISTKTVQREYDDWDPYLCWWTTYQPFRIRSNSL